MSNFDDRTGDRPQYEVGYKKPPKLTQFKPGQSGNGKGRPKNAKGLKADLREEMAERVTITENAKPVKISKQRLMVKSLVQKAAKGDVRAQNSVLELIIRVFGVEDERTAKNELSKNDKAILERYLSGHDHATSPDIGEVADSNAPQTECGGNGNMNNNGDASVAADDEEPENGNAN